MKKQPNIRTQSYWQLLTRPLTLSAALLCMAWQCQAVISVGPGGSGTNTFDTVPATTEFTTGVMIGTGPTYENVTALDAGVALIDAATIFDALATSATTPPSTFAGGFRYNTTYQALQSKPTTGGTNACAVLLAKLQNDTEADGWTLNIAYDFVKRSTETGALPGYYVYFSQSGSPGTWERIVSLSASEVDGRHTGTVGLAAAWPQGAMGYVLWVDDNADGVVDPGYTMDNMSFTMGPLIPIAITQQPLGTNVMVFRPFSLSVEATGTRPQYQWWKVDSGGDIMLVGETSTTYSVAKAQGTDTGDYYVMVSNAGGSVKSDVVHVEVITDDVPPTIVQSVGSATFTEVTIQFSEKMDPTPVTDPANFVLDGITSPVSAYLTNDSSVLVLVFDPVDAQATDTDYTVALYSMADLAGNPLGDGTTTTFHSWVPNALGGVVFHVFTGLSTTDNAIGQLTNNANFPYKPAESYVLNGLNTREVYTDDTHEGYGGRMWTLFVPLATGKYRFFTYSDDSSYIYLNPAGPDPAGKTLIAYDAGCCHPFVEPAEGITYTSEPIDLVAGQGYYIEGIYKEGTGGDYLVVGARLEGDPTPASALTNIMSSAASAPALPAGLVGPAVITAQPANATVEQPNAATFTAAASCAPVGPLLYQWQKSDDAGGTWANITGANGPSYTTGATLESDDNGDLYRVIVTSPADLAISDAATLTVNPDTTRPTVVSAVRFANLTTILITFSEPMDPETAADFISYQVCNTYDASSCLAVGGTVTLTNNNTQAYIETDPPTPNVVYRVTVAPEVEDAWGNPMAYPDFAMIGVQAFFQQGDANGYAGTTDAHVRSDGATTAYDLAVILVDNLSPLSHGLLKFDNLIGPNPGQVPEGAQVTAATLRLYTLNWGNPIEIHRMLVPWTEASTWNDVGTPNDGVNMTNDAVTTPEATFRTAEVDAGVNEWREIDVTASVQLWYTGGAPNHGWALRDTGDDGYQGSSSEATDQTLRPQLVITYTPSGATNAIAIVSQPPPTNVVNETANLTLAVEVTGSDPTYQWYQDDAEIPGATGASYVITDARAEDGGKYYCRISNLAGTVQTDDSWVIVVLDVIAPTVVSAQGGAASSTTVVVTFSEAVDTTTADDNTNYEIAGPTSITVLSAVSSGATVTLTLSDPRVQGQNYTLTVKDVLDRAATPNVIDPNPTTLPLATLVDLIAIETQQWKYLQQTFEGEPAPCLDGTTWAEPGYDDSAWQSGLGVFYGNRDVANRPATEDGSAVNTYLNLFTNAANAIQQTNYYFRTTFNLPSENTNGVSLLYHCMADDGAVFYLNGNRVGNLGFTADPASCASFASRTVNPVWDPALASPGSVLELTGLVPGQNTLAVQVGQVNATSSDIAFGLLLQAEVLTQIPPAPALSYVYDAVAQTLTLSWSDASYELVEADTLAGPWTLTSSTSPATVSTATGTKFYQLRK